MVLDEPTAVFFFFVFFFFFLVGPSSQGRCSRVNSTDQSRFPADDRPPSFPPSSLLPYDFLPYQACSVNSCCAFVPPGTPQAERFSRRFLLLFRPLLSAVPKAALFLVLDPQTPNPHTPLANQRQFDACTSFRSAPFFFLFLQKLSPRAFFLRIRSCPHRKTNNSAGGINFF